MVKEAQAQNIGTFSVYKHSASGSACIHAAVTGQVIH